MNTDAATDSFTGKVAIVIGGASGIGQAVCHEIAKRGATVVIADINYLEAERNQKHLASKGYYVESISLDISDTQSVNTAIQALIEQHNTIDYLFNCAGVGWSGGFETMPQEVMERMIAINLKGIVSSSHAIYPHMVNNRAGHIVNIASLDGLVPRPFRSIYSASKHAIVGFSQSLQGEARLHGVNVSVVCTGRIKTNIDANSAVILNGMPCNTRNSEPEPNQHSQFCARKILKAVERKSSLITFSFFKPVWWLHRMSPWLSSCLLYPLIARKLGVEEPTQVGRIFGQVVSNLFGVYRHCRKGSPNHSMSEKSDPLSSD